MITHAECRDIERRFGSPFYWCDGAAFVANYRRFETAFTSRHAPVRMSYSYKTNYLPFLCRLVRDLNGYAEVVSRLEYDLALRIGQDPAKIIFNGPVKSVEDLELALSRGATVNLDASYELDHVLAFARRHPERRPRIGLRVNMPLIDAAGVSHVQEGLARGRFGFPAQALPEVFARLQEAQVPVSALHGHMSSSSREAWIFEHIATTLCQLAQAHAPETIDEINVGGGFFSPLPAGFGPRDAPSYEDYAEAIIRALRGNAWARARRPTLTLEPGMGLVANVLSFITRVLDIKQLGDAVIAVVDGNVFHTRPSGHKKPQPFQVIRAGNGSGPARVLSVCGSTCMEKDYLLTSVACALAPGDYVRIDNVGAYTIVMSPTFIHPAPAIVTRENQEFIPLRMRQTFEQAFACYCL